MALFIEILSLAPQVWGRDGRPSLSGRDGRPSQGEGRSSLPLGRNDRSSPGSESRFSLPGEERFLPHSGGRKCRGFPFSSPSRSLMVGIFLEYPCAYKRKGRGYLSTNLWEIIYPVRDLAITRFLMPRSGRVQHLPPRRSKVSPWFVSSVKNPIARPSCHSYVSMKSVRRKWMHLFLAYIHCCVPVMMA